MKGHGKKGLCGQWVDEDSRVEEFHAIRFECFFSLLSMKGMDEVLQVGPTSRAGQAPSTQGISRVCYH